MIHSEIGRIISLVHGAIKFKISHLKHLTFIQHVNLTWIVLGVLFLTAFGMTVNTDCNLQIIDVIVVLKDNNKIHTNKHQVCTTKMSILHRNTH